MAVFCYVKSRFVFCKNTDQEENEESDDIGPDDGRPDGSPEDDGEKDPEPRGNYGEYGGTDRYRAERTIMTAITTAIRRL